MVISFVAQVRKCCKTGERLASLDNLSTKLECQPTSNNRKHQLFPRLNVCRRADDFANL